VIGEALVAYLLPFTQASRIGHCNGTFIFRVQAKDECPMFYKQLYASSPSWNRELLEVAPHAMMPQGESKKLTSSIPA